MNLYAGAVQRQDTDIDFDELHLLQKGKHLVQHTAFSPTVPSRIDCVPIAKMFRETPPFTALLHYIQNCIEKCQVVDAYVPALLR